MSNLTRKRAKSHLRWGWYQPPNKYPYVICPDCQDRVATAQTYPLGPPRGRMDALTERLAEHFENCEGPR